MKTLFDADRHSLQDALALTALSLQTHAAPYRHWVLGYSGGKDSSAMVAAVLYLIESGQVHAPQTLTVLYGNTKLELVPLLENARAILAAVRARGCHAEEVIPELDNRFMVYVLGRGVPPPTNTFRWCTERIKIMPMGAALEQQLTRTGEKALMLLGLRVGESAARDGRIALACGGKHGGECGTGWFHAEPPDAAADTLSPILHWRTCHVWDWLMVGLKRETNPYPEMSPAWQAWHRERRGRLPCHGLDFRIVAEVYDADEEGSANEVAARTGCVGCNLASQDFSLQRLLRRPEWAYLAPLRRLKPLWGELREHSNRLRKGNDERRKDGTLVSNPGRIGPLNLEARRWGLAEVLQIQAEVNAAADAAGRPRIDLIDPQEEARIRELIAANTWPDKWDGTELPGDTDLPRVYGDGTMQQLLFAGLEE